MKANVLRFYLDLDEGEIAASMRISRGTVKSTTSGALAALGRILAEFLRSAGPADPAGHVGAERRHADRPGAARVGGFGFGGLGGRSFRHLVKLEAWAN